MTSLITVELEAAVKDNSEVVEYNQAGKSYNNRIANEYLAELDPQLYATLENLADYLGIDLTETKYTFSVDYTQAEGGLKYFISQPCLIRSNGQPMIVWGEVKQPLANVKNSVRFGKNGNYSYLSVGEEGDEDAVELPVRLKEDYKTLEAAKLNKARREGNWTQIATYLRPTFQRTKPADAPKGVKLQVYPGATINQYGKYELEVEGIGIVTANKSMHNQYQRLEEAWTRKPELADYPVYVVFGEDYVAAGKNCVKVTLTQDIPVKQTSVKAFMNYWATPSYTLTH